MQVGTHDPSCSTFYSEPCDCRRTWNERAIQSDEAFLSNFPICAECKFFKAVSVEEVGEEEIGFCFAYLREKRAQKNPV